MSRLIALLSTGQTQILALVNAVLGLLIAFNVVFTQTQLGAVDVVVNALLAVVGAFLTQTANAQAKAARAKARAPKATASKP